MQNNVHDVYLPGQGLDAVAQQLRTIDPQILKRQARGAAASGEIADLYQGPQMAQALRMQNMEMPGVTGEGYSAQGPTLLQGIATMAANRMGSNKVKELENQAKALRGTANEGYLAELESQAQNQAINRQHQSDIAQQQSDARLAKAMAEMGGVASNYEPYVNETTGDIVYAARSKGKGVVDERGEPISIEGLTPFKESRLGRYGNRFGSLKAAERKDVIGADLMIRRLNEINSVADKLTADELKQLQQPGKDVFYQAASPAAFEAYITQNYKGLSENVKDYMQKLNNFAADIRHERFGSALTYNETRLAEAFLPSATGLTLSDRAKRIDSFANDARLKVESIDNMMSSDFLARLPEYNAFTISEDMKKRLAQDTGFNPAQEQVYETYNTIVSDLEVDNAAYKKATGEDMPEYLEAIQMRDKFKRDIDYKNMNPIQRRQAARRDRGR